MASVEHDVRSYIVKRTQIYLEESQHRQLAARAAGTGRTKSDLIRDAIDRYLGADDEDHALACFRAGLRGTAGIAPYLPSGVEYVAELRETDRVRDETLERHWRS